MKDLNFKFNQGSGDINVTITSELDESVVKEFIYQIASDAEQELNRIIENLKKQDHLINLKIRLGSIFKNDYLDKLDITKLEDLESQFFGRKSTEESTRTSILVYANKTDKLIMTKEVNLDSLVPCGNAKGIELKDDKNTIIPFLGYNVLANTEEYLGVFVESENEVAQMRENLSLNL